MKRVFVALGIILCSGSFAWGEEVKVVFTGQAYASLYPCACPRGQEGGVARRAALIKKIRAASGNVIVVEAGASFASGPEDQYSLNYELDLERTGIYLKSLELMGYDALLVSRQELVFGLGFLKQQEGLPFLSSNIEGYQRPYVIKDLGGIKVGILGLTDPNAIAKGLRGWQPAAKALEERVAELKKNGAGLIIVLSFLRPLEDLDLVKNVKGIDVVINGSPSLGSAKAVVTDGAVFVSTPWQARQLGVLTLDVKGSKVTMRSLDMLPLNADVSDDGPVAALLPACFSAEECKRMPGFASRCNDAASSKAQCVYVPLPPAKLTVIRPRACRSCRIEDVIGNLTNMFGELKVDFLYEDEPAAQEIIKEFKVTMLPSYVFPKDIEKSETFTYTSSFFERGGRFYLLKPAHSGVSYLAGRERVPKRLDVVFDFYKSPPELFSLLKAFGEKHKDVDIRLHFLALKQGEDDFVTSSGTPGVEEYKRIACVADLYPEKLLDYLIRRSQDRHSSWWEEYVSGEKMDAVRVGACARSAEGTQGLERRIRLTEELQIATAPVFIIDNKEIFGIVNVPSLEEFEKTVLGEEGRGQS